MQAGTSTNCVRTKDKVLTVLPVVLVPGTGSTGTGTGRWMDGSKSAYTYYPVDHSTGKRTGTGIHSFLDVVKK
jgi:hypothetical protein